MIEQYIILALSIFLIAVFLFIGDKIIGTNEPKFSGNYLVMALITALLIIVVIIAAGAVVGFLSLIFPGIGGIVPILGFILATYIVKMFLVKEDFQRSMWITLIAYTLVYITNAVALYLNLGTIIPYI